MFKKEMIVFLMVTQIFAVNLRQANENFVMKEENKLESELPSLRLQPQQLVATLATGCVEVFGECNFQGETASSCNGSLSEFPHPIYSAKVSPGWGISIVAGGVSVHVFQDLECLTKPLNDSSQNISVQAVNRAELENRLSGK